MQVIISYTDEDSLTPEEVVASVQKLHGKGAVVSVGPDNSDPFNLIYYAIQQLIAPRLINSFFDDGPIYSVKLKELREEALTLAENAVNQVITDTESKIVS